MPVRTQVTGKIIQAIKCQDFRPDKEGCRKAPDWELYITPTIPLSKKCKQLQYKSLGIGQDISEKNKHSKTYEIMNMEYLKPPQSYDINKFFQLN